MAKKKMDYELYKMRKAELHLKNMVLDAEFRGEPWLTPDEIREQYRYEQTRKNSIIERVTNYFRNILRIKHG